MDYTIDAKNKKLGRLASEIAIILQGKKSAYYEPRLAGQDRVVVENVKELSFSGNKLTKKKYYRHTGYMGHLKSKTLEQVFETNPAGGLRLAVERMLPKNFLQPKRMKRLIIK
ncbi:MAG: 50S ribosomal protein L13 [Candidatus Harrisonbacteria bacterium]|nr:50S ribosomal protein L13 [Candidatus Harrisonbacteria bacterium]